MNTPSKPVPAADTPSGAGAPETPDDPALEGEGNYTAARRHRQSLKEFVDSGQVEQAARDAEPSSTREAGEMQDAEEAGRSHARE